MSGTCWDAGRARRRGTISVPQGLLILLAGAVAGGVLWFAWSQSVAGTGEQPLAIPLVCGACRATHTATLPELNRMLDEASGRAPANLDPDWPAPMGACPTCGKLAVYRAGRNVDTGEIVLPDFVKAK